jgi:hypothetical protein
MVCKVLPHGTTTKQSGQVLSMNYELHHNCTNCIKSQAKLHTHYLFHEPVLKPKLVKEYAMLTQVAAFEGGFRIATRKKQNKFVLRCKVSTELLEIILVLIS